MYESEYKQNKGYDYWRKPLWFVGFVVEALVEAQNSLLSEMGAREV